jgi:hypothetical protein
MSALQIAPTQRVCRVLVSLPQTQLGTVSVSADGKNVVFGGIFGCSQSGDHPYQIAVVCFWGIFFVAKVAIIHTKLQCFFWGEFLFVAKLVIISIRITCNIFL